MGNRRNKTVEAEPLRMTPLCSKKRYAQHADAMRARHALYKVNQRQQRQRGLLDIFFCTSCDGWHIGHHKPWIKNE